MGMDLSQLTDAELDQLSAQVEQQNTSFIQPSALNNMAIAASKGLAAGMQAAATTPGLALRSFTDAMGITDKEVTDAQRTANADLKASAKQAGLELNAPISAKVGEVLGEYGPSFALGGAALSGAKGLLGAGRIADVAANAASGALISGIQDTGGDITKMADNAVGGGLLGGTLAGAAQGVGKMLAPRYGGNINQEAMQALKDAGVRPRASQVLTQGLSPSAHTAWEGIENTLNKIPVFGVKGVVKSSARKVVDNIRTTVAQLDDAVPKPSYGNFVESQNNAVAYNLGGVKRSIASAYNTLLNTKGAARNEKVLSYVKQLQSQFETPTNFRTLVSARHEIDKAIGAIKKNLTEPATDIDFRALAQIRGRVSDSLAAIARKNGNAREWATINKGVQDRLFFDGVHRAVEAAQSHGGRKFSITKFSKSFDDELNFMQKTMKLEVPGVMKQGVTNIKKLANLFASDTIKPGAPGITLLGPTVAVGAGGAVAGVMGAGIVGGVAGAMGLINKGLALMATTPYGIGKIASLGKITGSNPNVRQLAATAYALGQADSERTGKQERQSYLQNLSDEDLEALSQQAGVPNEGTQ